MPTLLEAIGMGELDAVMEKVEELNTDSDTGLIMLSSQYNTFKNKMLSNLLNDDKIRISRAKITNTLIHYIKEYNWEKVEITLKNKIPSSIADNTNQAVKILFLAVNPIGTSNMRLGKEAREIKERLRRSKLRDNFEFISEWAVRPKDLLAYIMDEKPDIVHFSGHGAEDEGLIFEDNNERKKPISPEAINDLFAFAIKRAPIKCVLLNACYSAEQAAGIAQSVDYVIGMTNAIWDKSAIAFSTGFYDSLGTGDQPDLAYEAGVLSIKLEGFDGEDYPVLHKKGS